MDIDSVLGGICLVSFAVLLWQWWEAARLPLHQRLQKTPYAPDVTLFKPLKGCEPRTMECIASWLEQDYPGNVQILFGVVFSAIVSNTFRLSPFIILKFSSILTPY